MISHKTPSKKMLSKKVVISKANNKNRNKVVVIRIKKSKNINSHSMSKRELNRMLLKMEKQLPLNRKMISNTSKLLTRRRRNSCLPVLRKLAK